MFHQIPHLRLYEEAAGAFSLGCICHGIGTNKGNTSFRQILQLDAQEFLRFLRMETVNIDLLATEGCPELLCSSILEFCLNVRSFFTQIQLCEILLGGLAIPEFIPMDKEILVLGIIVFLDEILVDETLCGHVINHVIAHHIISLGQGGDIIPVSESRVYLIIGNGCKSSVSRRGEKGKDVQSIYGIFQVLCQHKVQVMQIITHTVCIGDQHNFITYFFLHGTPRFRIASTLSPPSNHSIHDIKSV